ncbi:MAG: sigma-70 family RNA polymerase sigma factor [Synechococcaceae bacterium WB4_2_0805]|nr:sigma-70 family RNA polymerase sigma factor [Synechococcaceae bacterium WB4_2_0805]
MPAPQKLNRSSCDALTQHLRDIHRIPLLTNEEEITLARRVQTMRALDEIQEELTLRSCGVAPSLETWAAEAGLPPQLLQRRVRGGQRAKNRMVAANLRLVVSIARKYANRQLELEDAIQEGNLGLIKAVERFDPSRGYKFSTYAYWWIREGITRAIADKSRTVRLPVKVGMFLGKLRRAQQQLWQELGRTPTIEEVAEFMDIKPLDIREALFRAQQPLSLDYQSGSHEGIDLQGLIACPAIAPADQALQSNLIADLKKVLEDLPTEEATLMRLRYGINQEAPMPLSEVARNLGVSRDIARGIERRATAAIRHRSNQVIDYLES